MALMNEFDNPLPMGGTVPVSPIASCIGVNTSELDPPRRLRLEPSPFGVAPAGLSVPLILVMALAPAITVPMRLLLLPPPGELDSTRLEAEDGDFREPDPMRRVIDLAWARVRPMMLLPLSWWLGDPSMLPLGDISEEGSGFEDGETEGGRVTCRSRRGNVQI